MKAALEQDALELASDVIAGRWIAVEDRIQAADDPMDAVAMVLAAIDHMSGALAENRHSDIIALKRFIYAEAS